MLEPPRELQRAIERARNDLAPFFSKLSTEELQSIGAAIQQAVRMSQAAPGRLKDLLRRLGCTANLDDPTDYWISVIAAGRHAGLSEMEVWLHTERELCALLEFKAAESDRPHKPRKRRNGTSQVEETIGQRAERRQRLLMPILREKRWKRGRLITESGVGKATVYGFFDGTRKTISTENRKAIADVLGIDLKKLPV